MTARKTAGKKLVATLRGLLEQGYEFDEAEQHLLAQIEAETDRVVVLRRVLDAELAKPEVSTRRVTELSAEIRLLEKQVAGWCDSLRPKQTAEKSWVHQKAANARWRSA
ncbi:hypothetical protein ACPXB3_05815 [Gordonia sp. DT219]|uniref:hypothetical protein n=1 Tax=Gordonia sp. DT219 TaxID=3416658 RepID=UPI003CF43E88